MMVLEVSRLTAAAWKWTAQLEGVFEPSDKRLGSLERQMASLGRMVDEGFDQVRTSKAPAWNCSVYKGELLGRMDRQFFWILGLLTISMLSPIALRHGY